MRKVLLFITLAFIVTIAYSQTNPFPTASSTSSSFPTNGGPAAIASGTTGGLRLGIAGNQMLYGTASTAVSSPTLYFRNTTATTGKIWAFNSGDLGVFTISDATGTSFPLAHTQRFSINASGQVAIGAGTASSLLSLGTSLANSKLAVFDNGPGANNRAGLGWQAGQMRFHLSLATDKFSFLSSETASTDLMTILGSGKVGIGTSAPNASVNLDVLNNARVSNSFYVDRIGGNLSNALAIVARGAAEASNLGNPLGNGALEMMAVGTSGIAFGTNNAADIAFATGSSEKMRITSAGKIGIGTNAPRSFVTLDVAGNSVFSNSLWVDRADRAFTGTFGIIARGATEPSNLGNPLGNGAIEMMAAGASGILLGTNNAAAISLATNSTERIRVTSDGKVGIGVSAPNSLTTLDVAGPGRFSNALLVDRAGGALTNYFSITSRGATEASNFGNVLGNGATEMGTYQTAGLIMGTYDATPLVLGTSGLERFRVTSAGNIGIGTNSPAVKLDVSGDIKASNLRLGGGTYQGITATCLSTHIFNACGSLGYITLGFGANTGAQTATPDPLTIQQSNNAVGIRNNAPTEALDVTGNIKSTGFILPTGAGAGKVLTSLDATGAASWQTVNLSGSGLWSASGNDAINTNTGNVGIGTATPTAKLHVDGNILFNNLNSLNPGTASFKNIPIHGDGRWGLAYSTSAYANTYWMAQFRDQLMSLGSAPASNSINLAGVSGPLVLSDQGVHAAKFYIGNYDGPYNVSRLALRVSDVNEFITAGAYPSGVNYFQLETELLTPNTAANTGVTAVRAPLFVGGRYLKFNTGASNSVEAMRIAEDGKVGIGTIAPTAKFHTSGTVRFEGLAANNALTNVLVTDASGNLSFRDASTLGSGGGGSSYWTISGNNIVNSNTGYVSIGTGNTYTVQSPEVKLAVYGAIYATKLKVTAGGWADYVFDRQYKLLPLPELKSYISKNKHLPDVPSADQIQSDGINVGDTQALLLKKIEELTLYVLKQDEEIKKLQRKVNASSNTHKKGTRH